MKRKIKEGFKIICVFPKATKKNIKLRKEAQQKLINRLTYDLYERYCDFLKKYQINLEDIAKGKATIEDIRKRIELMDVHDNLSKIIILINDNPKVTLAEMAAEIGRCKKTVQRLIASSDKVVRLGSARNGYWKVKNSL